jgi:hypothetical protein
VRTLLSPSWIPPSIMNLVKEMNLKKTICSIGQTCTGVLPDSAISLGLTWDWRRWHLHLETWSDYSYIISQSMGEKDCLIHQLKKVWAYLIHAAQGYHGSMSIFCCQSTCHQSTSWASGILRSFFVIVHQTLVAFLTNICRCCIYPVYWQNGKSSSSYIKQERE